MSQGGVSSISKFFPQGRSYWGRAALGLLAVGGVTLAVSPVDALAFHAPLDQGHDAPVEQFQRPVTLTRTSPPRKLAHLAEWDPPEALARVGTYKGQPYAKGIIESVARREPSAVLDHAPEFRDQPYASEVIHQAITQALAKTPRHVLLYSDRFQDQPYAAAAVKQAAQLAVEHTPWAVLAYANSFQDQPYAAEVIRTAAHRAEKEDPAWVLMYSKAFKGQPYAAAVIKRAAENAAGTDPGIVLDKAELFQNEPYAAAVIKRAAEKTLNKEPFWALRYAKSFKEEPYAPALLQTAAERIHPYYLKPALEYANQFNDQPYAGGIIKTLLDRLPQRSLEQPEDIILEYADRFKTQPYALQYILAAAEKRPWLATHYFDRFQNQPYAEAVLKLLATKSPAEVLYAADKFKDQPYAATILMTAAEKSPEMALEYANRLQFLPQPQVEAIVKRAAEILLEEKPNRGFVQFDTYKQYPFAPELIKRAAEKSPGIFLKYSDNLKDQPYALPLIYQAAETMVQQEPRLVLQAPLRLKEHPDGKPLIHRAVDGALAKQDYYAILEHADRFAEESYAEQAITMAAEKQPFTALARMGLFAGQPYARGVIYKAVQSAVARQDRQALLAYVRLVNQMHDQPDEIRFAAVKDATAHDLYTLMVLGEEELFTSSFNGFFNRFLTAMAAEHLQGDQFLEQAAGPVMFRPFIKLCASYNRLTDFLETMPPEARTAVLTRFVKGIDREREPLAQAVAVADVFGIVRDPKMLKVFQDTIRAELERVRQENNKTGAVLYGLLGQLINGSAGGHDRLSAGIDRTFKLQNLASISAKELFNAEGVQVQQHFFYNDRDGQNSFESFLAQYRGDPAWTIEAQETFVHIHTSRNGRQIELFANRPDHERDGQHAIDKIFADRHVKPAMVVHRGHSYHALNTIKYIRDGTRIVYLGSCGSYNNVAAVLKASPVAHILSTKSTGTMLVNDPLLKLINEEMLSHDALQWGTVWGDAEAKLGSNPNFRNYVPPQKNLGVLFLKAYHHQMSKTGG